MTEPLLPQFCSVSMHQTQHVQEKSAYHCRISAKFFSFPRQSLVKVLVSYRFMKFVSVVWSNINNRPNTTKRIDNNIYLANMSIIMCRRDRNNIFPCRMEGSTVPRMQTHCQWSHQRKRRREPSVFGHMMKFLKVLAKHWLERMALRKLMSSAFIIMFWRMAMLMSLRYMLYTFKFFKLKDMCWN